MLNLKALMDSDADCCCIKCSKSKWMQHKSIQQIPVIRARGYTTKGNVIEKVNVQIYNKNYKINFISIENLSFDCIIDLDFMNKITKIFHLIKFLEKLLFYRSA